MAYAYEYNTFGSLYSVTDYKSREVTMYRYDTAGNLLQAYVYDLDTYKNLYGTVLFYDEHYRPWDQYFTFDYAATDGANTYMLSYAYVYDDTTGNLQCYWIDDDYMSGEIEFAYNKLNSLTQKTINFTANNGSFYQTIEYEYEMNGNLQGDRISEMVVNVGDSPDNYTMETTYHYTYDENGNIVKVEIGDIVICRYEYDDLGQLIREDNRRLGKSYVYEYDTAGNLTLKKEYTFTTGTLSGIKNRYYYTYENSSWGDQLTMVQKNTLNPDTITYDEIGNPTRVGFYNAMEGYYPYGYDLTWDGRELTRYRTFEGDEDGYFAYLSNIEFAYNADGIRTSKTVNGVKHEYYLSGSQILAEIWTENNVEHMLIYIYDEAGAPIGLKYRTDEYDYDVFDCFFFEKNLQGDIVAVYNENGRWLGCYYYDAWGNHTVSTLSASTTLENKVVNTYNPFRYRGYYYDVETGFYYLQSRYYNPEWCRFITMDEIDVIAATPMGLTDKNLYAYCDNNPITRIDEDGEFWNIIAGAVIGAVVNVAVSWTCAALSGEEYTWKDALVDAASGAITGAAASTGVCAFGQAVIGGFTSGASSIASDVVHDREIDLTRAVNAAAAGFGLGYLGGAGIRTTTAFQGAGSLWSQSLTKAMLPTVVKTTGTFAGTAFLGTILMRSYDRINP